MSISVKQSDTRPVVVYQLVDASTGTNVPINLTTATTVKFKMRLHGATTSPKVSSNCVITDAVNGKVQYTFGATDLDTIGQYDVEFEITWSDTGITTIPNDGYMTLNVVEDLDH